MRSKRRYALAATSVVVLLSIPASAGQAQPAQGPIMLPTRDVVVTYRIDNTPSGAARKLEVAYSRSGERIRIDYFRQVESNSAYQSVVFDRPDDRIMLIVPESKAYIENSIGDSTNPGAFLKPGMQFTRDGTATVANTPCTEWRTRQPDRNDDLGVACVAADGVVLRLAAARPTEPSLTALHVQYVSPSDTLFDAPAGFTRIRRPNDRPAKP